MAIIRRTPIPGPKKVRKFIIRRAPAPDTRKFADSIEEYVFSIPINTPMKYTEVVMKWLMPYQHNHFELFGKRLKLTPVTRPINFSDKVEIYKLLITLADSKKTKQFITGPQGTWYAKIKFFVKANSAR